MNRTITIRIAGFTVTATITRAKPLPTQIINVRLAQ